MKKSVFDDESQQIVLKPESWRIVGSLFEPEVEPVLPQRYQAWMESHVDHHPARELFIALHGRGWYGFRGRAYACEPGSVFLFDADEPHDSRYHPGSPPMRHLWFFVFGSDVIARLRDIKGGRIIERASPALILTGTAAAALLASTWNELAAAPRLPAPLKRARLVAALAATLAQIAAAEYGETSVPPSHTFATTVIEAIRRHVAEHAGRGIPLAEAARLSGYSTFHFCRLFRRHTGQTYHAYVDACRLRKARELLSAGRRKKEIAEALGFSHPSACLRWMKSRGRGP